MGKSAKGSSTTFKKKQRVVYPLQGVGQITDIIEMEFKGEPTLYYDIYIPVTDMVVKIPVDRAEEHRIRAIVPRDKAEAALEKLTEPITEMTADWKQRHQENQDLLKTGSIEDVTTVVRTLYARKKVKELPIMERKLYDLAMQLMIDECSFSLDISTDAVQEIIFSKLEVESDRGASAIEDDDEDDLDDED